VVAYVIDSGINATPGIPAARIREHREFVPNETRTDDCANHGTYVAEVLGGATYGVAKDVVFVNYRVLDCANAFASDSTVVEALDAMVLDHNSRPGQMAVANLSLFTRGAHKHRHRLGSGASRRRGDNGRHNRGQHHRLFIIQ
jgi:subtilisin family serine protease